VTRVAEGGGGALTPANRLRHVLCPKKGERGGAKKNGPPNRANRKGTFCYHGVKESLCCCLRGRVLFKLGRFVERGKKKKKEF